MKQAYEANYAKAARDYNYTDEMNRPAKLTADEVAYFDRIAAMALAVSGAKINIYTRDHEQVDGNHDALGLYWWSAELGDQFITIDNYFIHECYRAEVLGSYHVFRESLAEAICHELAHHLSTHKHTKTHEALTQQLLAGVRHKEISSKGYKESARRAAERRMADGIL